MRSVATSILAALGLLALVLGLSGCDARSDISASLQGDLSQLDRFPQINELTNFDELAEPGPDIRSVFTSTGSVYRVMEASEDHALIAVWRVRTPEGRSVEDLRDFTASACATLDRNRATVTSTVVDCPHTLAEFAPSAESGSWARDSAPTELAVVSAHQLNADLRWLLFYVDGGQHRGDEVVSLNDVARTIDSADLTPVNGSVEVTTTALVLRDNHVTGAMRITASAPDETDNQSTTSATVCFALDVDLAARATGQYDNWTPLTEASC